MPIVNLNYLPVTKQSIDKIFADHAIISSFLSIETSDTGDNTPIVLRDHTYLDRDKTLCRMFLKDSTLVVFQLCTHASALHIAHVVVTNGHMAALLNNLEKILNQEKVTIVTDRQIFLDADSTDTKPDKPVGVQKSEVTVPSSLLDIVLFSADNFTGSWGNLETTVQLSDRTVTYLDMLPLGKGDLPRKDNSDE